jgi:hypothetical protein
MRLVDFVILDTRSSHLRICNDKTFNPSKSARQQSTLLNHIVITCPLQVMSTETSALKRQNRKRAFPKTHCKNIMIIRGKRRTAVLMMRIFKILYFPKYFLTLTVNFAL